MVQPMKKLLIFASLGALLWVNLGCSGSSEAADDKALRQKFAKEKFDMNDVPPSQRAMVQGFIDRAKHAPPGKQPAAGN